MAKAKMLMIAAILMGTFAARANSDVYRLPGHDGGNTAKRYILTPKEPLWPLINGPKVYGVTPGKPILYRLPVTGERPLKVAAENLPAGVNFDSEKRILSGAIDKIGVYTITFAAENKHGKEKLDFKIVVGDKIALTPPMGWNSWTAWAGKNVTQQRIKDAADAIVELGLADYGWRYVNIDDGWQGERVNGVIQPNEKFPDMQALCDHIHGLGLKAGIYSTAWTKSFQGKTGESAGEPVGIIRDEKRGWYVGKEQYEMQDAAQWAKWGIDYLKYDWHPMDLAAGRRMHKALRASGRDIVYSVCNAIYREKPEEWAKIADVFFLWRVKVEDATNDLLAADIKDEWDRVSEIGFSMDKWRQYVSPGHWNDPDTLVVGAVGWGQPKPSRLTPNEQYTQVSLWSLINAPLIIGCDFAQTRDEFTLSLLKNREVIAINQDELGQMAGCIKKDGQTEVWAKDLMEGSKAVGLFNRGEEPKEVTISFKELGLSGKCKTRDIWRQTDIGTYENDFTALVPVHGMILIKIAQQHSKNLD